ncbi:MAG: hypothetical protein VB093_12090 [Propionicimonas sp.]|nr:hypothetical protein [Propionicimonas sp.]
MSLHRDTKFSRIERFAWLLGRWLQDWAEAAESNRRYYRRGQR